MVIIVIIILFVAMVIDVIDMLNEEGVVAVDASKYEEILKRDLK